MNLLLCILTFLLCLTSNVRGSVFEVSCGSGASTCVKVEVPICGGRFGMSMFLPSIRIYLVSCHSFGVMLAADSYLL